MKKKISKNLSRIAVLLLLAVFLLPSFVSCALPPPELDSVRDQLVALLEASYGVNDILFGGGLVTEYELSGLNTEYTDEVKNAEGWMTDEQIFQNYYSPVVESYMKDTDGDGIGDTKVVQPTSVEAIKELCRAVYSEDFLNKYFQQVFVGQVNVAVGQSQVLKPRYRDRYNADDVTFEDTNDTGSSAVMTATLSKYIFLDETNMNFIESRGGRTVYDYDTMRIIEPSDADTLNVEIKAYYQRQFLDTSSDDVDDWSSSPEYVWEKIVICFVKENGAWRLDNATY